MMAEISHAGTVQEAKSRIKEVTPQQAMTERDADTVFLDVREANEWNVARIPGAVFLPLGSVEAKVEETVPRDKKVVVYCRSGNRSAFAADTMRQLGYTDVASMSEGIQGWADAGGEIE
jgi:rhodanese-related sulfurtransferase